MNELQGALIKKLSRRTLASIFVVVVLLLGVLGIQLFIAHREKSDFPAGIAGPQVRIVVTQGESGSAIARDLEAQKVVAKASTVISKLIAHKVVGIAPGIHLIQSVIPSDEAIAQLLDQKRIIDSIEVLPGSTFADIVKKLHLASSLRQSDSISSLTPILSNNSHSLEGQFAPVQYSFQPGTTTHDAIATMLKTFGEEISRSKLSAGYGKFSPYQVLTVASLLQIEGDPGDYGKVARVIYNRLSIGMPLQLNSTVQYALGLRGQIGLSIKATRAESLYNTYLHTGLPPTPISNPSIQAITGALNPENGNWLYFITVAPHDTRFTAHFPTFESWVALYNRNVRAGAFK